MTERTRYREVTESFTGIVSHVERMGTTHVRVVLGAMPALALLDTIAVDVGGGAMRRYTVSGVGDGSVEFVAYRTQRGPATMWLDALAEGTTVSGLAPERPVKMPPDTATRVVVAGDESAVGVARAIATAHAGRVVVGLVGTVDAVIGAPTTVVDTEAALLAWVTEHVVPGAHVVLVGAQALNQTVRQHVFGLGVDKESLATRTFWRPDKAGIE